MRLAVIIGREVAAVCLQVRSERRAGNDWRTNLVALIAQKSSRLANVNCSVPTVFGNAIESFLSFGFRVPFKFGIGHGVSSIVQVILRDLITWARIAAAGDEYPAQIAFTASAVGIFA